MAVAAIVPLERGRGNAAPVGDAFATIAAITTLYMKRTARASAAADLATGRFRLVVVMSIGRRYF